MSKYKEENPHHRIRLRHRVAAHRRTCSSSGTRTSTHSDTNSGDCHQHLRRKIHLRCPTERFASSRAGCPGGPLLNQDQRP